RGLRPVVGRRGGSGLGFVDGFAIGGLAVERLQFLRRGGGDKGRLRRRGRRGALNHGGHGGARRCRLLGGLSDDRRGDRHHGRIDQRGGIDGDDRAAVGIGVRAAVGLGGVRLGRIGLGRIGLGRIRIGAAGLGRVRRNRSGSWRRLVGDRRHIGGLVGRRLSLLAIGLAGIAIRRRGAGGGRRRCFARRRACGWCRLRRGRGRIVVEEALER